MRFHFHRWRDIDDGIDYGLHRPPQRCARCQKWRPWRRVVEHGIGTNPVDHHAVLTGNAAAPRIEWQRCGPSCMHVVDGTRAPSASSALARIAVGSLSVGPSEAPPWIPPG